MAERLSQEATVDLLASDYGLADPDVADRVYEATAGVTALVRLSARALAARGELFDDRLADYVTHELIDPLPEPARLLLGQILELAPVTAELVEAIGLPSGELGSLERAHLLVDRAVVPVVAQALRTKETATETLLRAGRWYEENGPLVSAVRAYVTAGAGGEWTRIVDDHGGRLLAAGHATLLTELLPQIARTRDRQLLLGDALRLKGDLMSAGHAYMIVADTESEWDAAVAWRLGQVHYLRGDSKAALKAFDQATKPGPSRSDDSLLLSGRAVAHLQLGEQETATELANQAVGCAVESEDDTALATAYISLALCLTMTGDPTELYAQALTVAARAGDVALRTRVLTNQTYQMLCEARYGEALETARLTYQCAVAANHAALALSNQGDALCMLGRFDEAIRQYQRALGLIRRMGSRRTAFAHLGLGEVYRRRGWLEQARGAYEEAARQAGAGGNVQVQVCALAGLARVLLVDDLEAAEAAASEAVSLVTSKVEAMALVARGWVALRSGQPTTAATLAGDAAKVARADKDLAGLAEALELRAATESDRRRIRTALREAHAIWVSAGAAVEAARVMWQLGHLPDADTDGRLGAMIAAGTLAKAGVLTKSRTERAVMIRAFGRFEVSVDGRVVSASQWRSRKARDLLRILVARRGRPIPRAELCELLWPDDDPFKTGHRLSVLLSIVRNALDPDRRHAPDHYLVADQACVGLDITRVRVDVEDFLTDAMHGRRLRDRAAVAEAQALLESAQAAYRAEVFEDEPYSEWSIPLREEARAAYIGVLRMLAQLSEPDAAVACLLRLLTIDPYDEAGHQALIEALVAGGQHGEARRAFIRYQEAMRSIGMRPAYQHQAPMSSP